MKPKYRLLVVDDDSGIRDFIEMLFTDEGYITAQACDGRDALAQMDGFSPHIVMLDLQMPLMDGLALLKTLCQSYPQAAIIVMSATPKLIAQAQEICPCQALQKPCDIADILAAVENCLPGIM